MTTRPWLWLSLGANAMLLGILFWQLNADHRRPPEPLAPSTNAEVRPPARANVVVRRQNFTWHQVESDDYATYILNLRDLGVPESTIRDIIVADVDQLYAHKRVTDVVSADHQWWRSDPDPEALEEASTRMAALESEKRALITRLLGLGWDAPANPLPPVERTGISLSGPVLGAISSEKKKSVYEITARAQQGMESYVQNQAALGQPLDPQQLARMRQQTRLEVGQGLSPDELEEFLLRYSKTAGDLREELRGVNVSSNEFRALFKARDPLDQQLELFYVGRSPSTVKSREGLELQRDGAMKQVLGAERFTSLKLAKDPLFQETQQQAEQLGLPAETVLPTYEINKLTGRTAAQIQQDSALTREQKATALRILAEEYDKAVDKVSGLNPSLTPTPAARATSP